jgi:hypothetical protein
MTRRRQRSEILRRKIALKPPRVGVEGQIAKRQNKKAAHGGLSV